MLGINQDTGKSKNNNLMNLLTNYIQFLFTFESFKTFRAPHEVHLDSFSIQF
jgi:hypothetical protein